MGKQQISFAQVLNKFNLEMLHKMPMHWRLSYAMELFCYSMSSTFHLPSTGILNVWFQNALHNIIQSVDIV